MKQFNNISDEELAAYLDGMLENSEMANIDKMMDVDTLEVLSVSQNAMDEFPSDNVIHLPSWDKVAVASVQPIYTPLAMAGFLDECNADEEDDSDETDDNDDVE